VSELAEQLRAADAPSRAAAAWGLAGAGTVDVGVYRALVAALDDPSEPVREAATWALSYLDPVQLHNLMEAPPKPLVMTRPQYPRPAFDKKIAGTVEVRLLISALGKVVHAEIGRSIPGLDEAALACVRDWQFQPARRGGHPAPSAALAPVKFRLF